MSAADVLRSWAYLSRVAEAPCDELAALIAEVGPLDAAHRIRRGEVVPALARRTEARRDMDCAAADLEMLQRRGGRLITPDDDEWPTLAFAAFGGAPVRDKPQGRPPLALWVIGPVRLDGIAERSAAIVGTRAATAYGEHVAAELSAGLVERDVAVVSGGAYGIDGAAHRAALAAEGITVAVLAGGLDVLYPAGHSALLHRISQEGLLVSEYPPGVRPARHRFLTRNRLVAALSGATVVVEAVFATEAAEDRFRPLLAGLPVHPVTDRAMKALSETVTPAGLVAVCRLPGSRLDDVLAEQPALIVVAVDVADPGNAGTLIRLADAMGVAAVVFAGDAVDPYNGKCVRSSAGSIFAVPVCSEPDTAALIERLRAAGLQILATTLTGELSLDDAQPVLAARTAWLFGPESRGLSDEVAGQADRRVVIPMSDRVDSLNVAAAAAICLYQSARALRGR